MTMNVKRAFDSRMMTKLTVYPISGVYNEYNDYVFEVGSPYTIRGVWYVGNRFAQFDEGIAVKNENGGARYSNYRTLYTKKNLNVTSKVAFEGVYYNILQKSDEKIFGFTSYLVEEDKNWSPTNVN